MKKVGGLVRTPGPGRESRRNVLWLGTALAVALIAVLLLVAGVLFLLAELTDLQDQVRAACLGPVAQLDLSRWVPVCRDVLDL